MRIVWLAAWLCVLQFVAVAVRADDIKEADYPNQYEVVEAGKTGKIVEKTCSMTLHDKAKPDVTITVSRKAVGSCQPLDSGKVYRGRENQKKNEIEIVVPVGDTKARVENWQINGIVNTTPTSERPGF